MTPKRRIPWLIGVAVASAVWLPNASASAQNPTLQNSRHPTLRTAVTSLDALEYEQAITLAQRALNQRLAPADRATAWEVLAFSYGALDSTRQAVEAFRELILIDPDREPDPVRVSPRITALYSNALGQVLVVRRLRVERTEFIAGQGTVPIRFEVPRLARVSARVVGGGIDRTIDSVSVAGPGQFNWTAMKRDGDPVPAGRYQLIIEAASGPNQYASQVVVEIDHGIVDTLDHNTSVPGREFQSEFEQPPRNWRPLGLAALYTAFASGASLALENSNLANPPRREIGGVSVVALVTGFVMSLKKPDPRPVPANILYNQLLREELVRLNEETAADNAQRRRQVLLSVEPVVNP